MSHQIIASELLVTLSHQQQEFLVGGSDFELSGSNYANRLASLQGATTSGPNGSAANSIGVTSAVNTASQDLLGLGSDSVPNVGALGGAPILDGLAGGNNGFGNNGIGLGNTDINGR